MGALKVRAPPFLLVGLNPFREDSIHQLSGFLNHVLRTPELVIESRRTGSGERTGKFRILQSVDGVQKALIGPIQPMIQRYNEGSSCLRSYRQLPTDLYLIYRRQLNGSTADYRSVGRPVSGNLERKTSTKEAALGAAMNRFAHRKGLGL